ncbi:uncharacterized protein MEPE_04887 [Melanopsichium pennsylvanicum]|uniref:Reverse transcriptase domain-containing protein n=1 Tax=Melanopsichium pennsylvanicum TaxID=63383 RepID=A0AAJ4XPY7_9BASI|nr:uncharacterized protein MEPE_04887 [Melanopsichium pennsylvanicum]
MVHTRLGTDVTPQGGEAAASAPILASPEVVTSPLTIEAIIAAMDKKLDERLKEFADRLPTQTQSRQSKSESQRQQRLEAEAAKEAEIAKKRFLRRHGIGIGIDDNTIPADSDVSPTPAPPSAIVSTSSRRPSVKPEDIGTYDGSSDLLEFFLGRVAALVESRQDPAWESAIIEVLPLCLRKTASQWYQLLGSPTRRKLNTSWAKWETALRNAFQPDASEIRRLADERRWDWTKESIAAYFYAKLSLLRAAYPTRVEGDLLHKIRLGLPSSLQLDVRSHMAAIPNMDNLLIELRNLEGPWRATLKSSSSHRAGQRNEVAPQQQAQLRFGPPFLSSSNHLGIQRQDMGPRAPTPTRSEANNRLPAPAGLSASYNPANISYIHKDGRNIRAYKLPSNGRPIYLSRSCRVCSQDHFGFEHEFLSRQPKAEAHIAQAELELAQAYGYPTTCFEPIYISDDDSNSPDTSFARSVGEREDRNVAKLRPPPSTSNGDRGESAACNPTTSDNTHHDVNNKPSPSSSSVFLLDPTLLSRSVQPLRRRKNPDSTAVHLPPAHATGSGQAFAGHIPTTAFVSLADTEPRLSLLDTGATLSIVDEQVARELHLLPLNGPGIRVNGVGEDRSLGFVTLDLSIQGRRDNKATHLHSSADFHILRDFKPGVLLGLDVIRSCGIVIDVKSGRATVGDVSFPVYDTRGKAMSAKSVSRAIVAKATTIIAPHSHTLVPVNHHLLEGVQYVMDSSLWTAPDGTGPLALSAAVLDSRTAGIWVSNFDATALELLSDARLADAIPLAPDDLAASAGSFQLDAHQIEADPRPALRHEEKQMDRPDQSDHPIDKTRTVQDGQRNLGIGQGASNPRNADPRVPSPAAAPRPTQRRRTVSLSLDAEKSVGAWPRASSFDDHWPRLPFAFPTLSQSIDTAQPLDFSNDELANSPKADELESVLVDDCFNVGKDAHGQPHTSIVAVLCNNVDAFSLDGRPGHVKGAGMRLDLNNADALRPEAPRRVSPDKRRVIDESLDQLLDWDVVEPSSSPVLYPVLLVKQGKKWRFCVDYRGLNTATVADRYPLPRIDDVFQALRGHRYFSGLDAIRGYHQIDIEPEDRWKTAFVSHRRLYQYKRVPFGLKNAPAFFQRFMDHLLGHMRWTEAVVYLDDVVIFSPTLDQHAKSLDCLLKAAHKVGLKFLPSKCHFALSSLKLLGR